MNKSDLKPLYLLIICLVVLGIFSIILEAVEKIHNKPTLPPSLGYIPQFVLLSFDGSKSLEMWAKVREFERQLKSEDKALNFTFFINAAYFLTPDKKDLYQAPREASGKSNIGFADNVEDIRGRILEVNKAVEDGDEIASHTLGHYWGGEWSALEWAQEFNSFDEILFNTDKNFPDANFPRLNLSPEDIIGFRAPALSVGPGLYQALREANVKYDSSEVTMHHEWPKRDAYGIWHIPLGTVYLDAGRSPVVAMDYSIRAHETKANPTDTEVESSASHDLKKGTETWDKIYKDVLSAYNNYFEKSYKGNRAPIVIGHHFATWDDYLYLEVLKEFASGVCGKPEVRCVTYRDFVNYLDIYGVPKK